MGMCDKHSQTDRTQIRAAAERVNRCRSGAFLTICHGAQCNQSHDLLGPALILQVLNLDIVSVTQPPPNISAIVQLHTCPLFPLSQALLLIHSPIVSICLLSTRVGLRSFFVMRSWSRTLVSASCLIEIKTADVGDRTLSS